MADLTADFVKQMAALFAKPEVIDLGDGLKRVLTKDGDVTQIEPFSHSEFADTPPSIEQVVTLRDVESFTNYWNLYSDADSRVFADRDGGKFTAVLDYHVSDDGRLHTARWGTHKAVLQLRHTEEWTAWLAKSGQKMTQAEFAEFIEDNAPDIFEPPSAIMLELATTLDATTSAQFEQATNLHNGQVQLSFREDVKGTFGGAEKKTVPREFKIQVSVYEGQPLIVVVARIRYRITGGKLTIWYDLLHTDRRKREAFELVTDQIAKAGISVFNGAAE